MTFFSNHHKIGTESTEQIKLRLANAIIEEKEAREGDYKHIFHKILVNDDFQATVNSLFRFVRDS